MEDLDDGWPGYEEPVIASIRASQHDGSRRQNVLAGFHDRRASYIDSQHFMRYKIRKSDTRR
jgi:hypothetical protein